MWFYLNFIDQSSLFRGLSNIHHTSALATEEGNAFESQNGATKVKPGDHCDCDSRHIYSCIVTESKFCLLAVQQDN